jgi:GTP-binding protein Era
MNAHMMELVTESLTDVEVALYVVDSTREPGEEEDTLAASVARFDGPVVCAVNKVDAAASRPEQLEEFVTTRLPRAQLRRVSAATGDGTAELLDALFDVAPIGEQMYPEEYYTDQDPEFRVGEIIREKAIAHLRQELPHSLFVDVADMEVQDGVLWIRAFLIVERESQKGIVVGRGGSGIKNIRIAAKREIKELFPYEGIRLDLRVKVYKGWRKSEAILKRVVR